MVKNILISVKWFIKRYVILLLCLMLYLLWTDTGKTRSFRSDSASLPVVTTTIDSITTTEGATEQTTEQIVHSYSFKYLHLPPQVCEKSGAPMDPFLMILVKSSVMNIGHREAIRLTWGRFNNTNIKLVFMLGYSELIKQYVNMENSLYNDIVQQDFVDDYFNNTIKTIMAFDWVVTYCPETKFVFFVDDDYFVNLPQILSYLDKNVKIKTKNLIAGYKYIGGVVRRKRDSKWYVSEEDYPNSTWPPYISGGSMVMDFKVAKRIHDKIPFIKPLFIDDVYLGIVAQALNIELWNERKFEVHYLSNNLGNLFSAHSYGPPSKLIFEWKRVKCQHKQLFQTLYSLPDC